MKYLSCLIAVLFFLGNYSYANTVYDNGQHNIIGSYLGDSVQVFDSADQATTIEVIPGGNISNLTQVYGTSELIGPVKCHRVDIDEYYFIPIKLRHLHGIAQKTRPEQTSCADQDYLGSKRCYILFYV